MFVDKRVLLRHTGTYVFDGTTQQKLYEDLAAVINPVTAPTAPQLQPQGGHDIEDTVLQAEPASTVLASNIDSEDKSTEATAD